MNYSVVWKPSAKDELADIWLGAVDRNAVTQAAHAIDVVLRLDPKLEAQSTSTPFVRWLCPRWRWILKSLSPTGSSGFCRCGI